MEWDPTERDAWVADAQRWLGQITGVLQCKIDLNDSGEVEGIHVVAGMDRDPRHIVRDVEGLLKTRLDLDVYYKKIGVVQVLDNSGPGPGSGSWSESKSESKPEPEFTPQADRNAVSAESQAAPAPDRSPVTIYPPGAGAGGPEARTTDPAESHAAATGPRTDQSAADGIPDPIPAILVAEDYTARVICEGVGVMASEMVTRAEVRLRLGEVAAEGVKEGPNHADSDLQLVAEATLAALAQLISDPVLLHLREVRLAEIGAQTTVLTAVDLIEGRLGQTLYGVCGANHNRQQAVVYSILDALNRRLSQFGLRSSVAEG